MLLVFTPATLMWRNTSQHVLSVNMLALLNQIWCENTTDLVSSVTIIQLCDFLCCRAKWSDTNPSLVPSLGFTHRTERSDKQSGETNYWFIFTHLKNPFEMNKLSTSYFNKHSFFLINSNLLVPVVVGINKKAVMPFRLL